MKVKNLMVAIALVLFATAGAIASAKSVRAFNVFYKVNASAPCLQGTSETICDFISSPNCIKTVTPLGGGTPVSAQIYQSRDISNQCQQAYSLVP